MIEIDVTTALLPRHRLTFDVLATLARKLGNDRWCLVGGLMVLLNQRRYGLNAGGRAAVTKDADVVVDLIADQAMLLTFTSSLRQMGFAQADVVGSGDAAARCSFVFSTAHVDVLCPDDTDHTQLALQDGTISLAMPGGRRALELSEIVEVLFDIDKPAAEIRLPTIAGAIIVKAAAAVDPRTQMHHRHIFDVAQLLALVDDPVETASAYTTADRRLLFDASSRLQSRAEPVELGDDELRRALTAVRLMT